MNTLEMLKKHTEMLMNGQIKGNHFCETERRRKAYDELYMDRWNHDACKYDLGITDGLVNLILEPYMKYLGQDKRTLPQERCCLYETEDFNWFYTIEDIFNSYENICRNNGINPIKFNSYNRVNKIPFIETEDLKKIHEEIVKTFLDLREHNVYGSGKLPSYLTSDDIVDFIDNEVEDSEFAMYLINFATFTIEYDSTLNQMSLLCVLIRQLRLAPLAKDSRAVIDICKSKFNHILDPYTDRLKGLGVLPDGWKYTFLHMNDYLPDGTDIL